MNRNRIHINDLRLRLPNGMSGNAREFAGAFGRGLMRTLADRIGPRTGSAKIEAIAVEDKQNFDPGHVADKIAGRVTETLDKNEAKR